MIHIVKTLIYLMSSLFSHKIDRSRLRLSTFCIETNQVALTQLLEKDKQNIVVYCCFSVTNRKLTCINFLYFSSEFREMRMTHQKKSSLK